MELSCAAAAAASRAIYSTFSRNRPFHTTILSPVAFSSLALPRDLLFSVNFSSRSFQGIRVTKSMSSEEDYSYASVVKEKDEDRTVDDEVVVELKSGGSSVIEYSEDPVAGELSDAMDFLSKLDLKFFVKLVFVGTRTSILVNFLQFYRKGRVEGKRYIGSIFFGVTMPLKDESPIIERELPPASERNDEMNFLSKPTLKLEAGETYSILAYGVGVVLTLWLSSAVVGALDSLPVFPKLMEIIGLGFTIWFSYRYLIFKRNRDELFAKIEDLKEQILGPSE